MAGVQRKQTFGVKVSEIPNGVTEGDLQPLFSKFGNISSIHFKNSKPLNHAYINYDSQQNAAAVANAMNGFSVSGGTIKVQLQGTGGGRHKPTTSESVLSKETVTDSTANQFSVKISNINPNTTQEVLSQLFKTRVVLQKVSGKKSYAYANYSTQEEMQAALNLHGTSLDGLQISVKKANSPRSSSQSENMTKEKSQMSINLHKFFLSKMTGTINELETKGGKINWDNGFLHYTAPNSETLMRFKTTAVDCLFEDTLQLSVESWNKLMAVFPNGSNLFQQLTLPFNSNPNVEIYTDVAALKVIFFGFKAAVQDAVQAIGSALYKDIPIDRVKMLYTLRIFPNLQADLEKEFSIAVQGFFPGSSQLVLSGNRSSFYEPYLRITNIINRQNVLTATCFGLLIPSVQKRISLERLPAVLCAHSQNNGEVCYAEVYSNNLSQVNVLVCGPDDVPQKVSAIINSPESKEVVLANVSAMQNLKSLPQCNFTQLLQRYGVYIKENPHRPSFIIQGYVQDEVMSAVSILSGAAVSIPTPVSPPLPVLPSFTHTEKINYYCHPNFKSQIQEYVTEPLQQQLRVTISFLDSDLASQSSPAKHASETGKNPKKAVISLLVHSNFEEDFSDACGKLKEIKPQSKFTNWSKKEYEVLSKKVKKQLKDFEKSNRVRIIFHEKSSKVGIYGLTAAEVSASEYHLRDSVEASLVIESQISVSRYECLFLRKKYRSDLYELCKVQFPDFQSESESANLVLEGSKTKVDLARQKINEALNELQVKLVSFQHDSYGEMWKRKWYELKKQEEAVHNVVVHVYAVLGEKSSKNPADVSLNVKLAIIGKDIDSISKIESTVTDIGSELLCRTESISRAQLAAIKEGFKSKKLPLRENHNTEVVWNHENLTIDLIAPNGSSEELDAAYNLLMAYTEGVAVSTEKVHFRYSVLGLFLQQQRKHWQQIVTIAKQNSVSAKLVGNGISLRGKLGNTGNAKKSIEEKLQKLLELFEERKIKVDDMLVPVLDTHGFEGIIAKVRQDHCSILTKSKAVQSIQVSKPDGFMLTIEVCIGSVYDETSEAIVNASSFNAQSSIKELVDAGGPTIKQEYDDYVAKYGAVNLCEAICLGSGDLKCSKVIHVKLPEFVNGSLNELAKISESIKNTLSTAEKHSIRSISIPSFSFNSSAYSECVRALLQTTFSLCADGTLKHLEMIRFAVSTKEIATTYCQKLLELQGAIPGLGIINSGKLLTQEQSFVWFRENDFGCLEPYTNDESATLSQKSASAANCKLTVKGSSYTVDFSKMLQVNDQTSKSRRIEKRRLQPFWKYQNDKGHWDLYTEEQSQAIETMWQNKQPSILQIGKWKYTISFNNTPMAQINTITNRSREICRVDSTQNVDRTTSVNTSLLLVGLKKSLDMAEQEVKKFLDANLYTEEIPIATIQLSSVAHEIGKKCNVAVSDLAQNRVMLKGLSTNVMKAAMEINMIALQDYTKADEQSYPIEWEPQNEELELKQLGSGTQEWSKVSQQFQTTLPSAMIVKIERVQNKWLWEKYFQHAERMKKKNGGNINEKMLFHGTRNTPPSSIYNNEEGFDMRFSNAGMWGTGNYFAVNARYSNSYSHHLPDGTKQMFLAKVLTGDSIQLQPDNRLRMPPEKSSSKGVVRYDTVTGQTGGSQVFIAYSNDKAYPFYLISYK